MKCGSCGASANTKVMPEGVGFKVLLICRNRNCEMNGKEYHAGNIGFVYTEV